MGIIKVIDQQERKKIIVVTDKKRIILKEGKDYPKNGLVGMSLKKFKEDLAKVS